jgi:hypothetical protein
MDSASGFHSANSVQWKFFGENDPELKSCILPRYSYASTSSVVILALKDPNRNFWMVTLTSLVGFVMPSPQMVSIKQPRPPPIHQFAMANHLSKPQYDWKQNGTMKREWFPDKKTCVKHCEQHNLNGPVYLYKRVVIPTGWVPFILKSKYQSFR